MRQSLLERRLVHVRVTADLSWLQEREEVSREGVGGGMGGGGGEQQGGVVRRHPLDEVDSVEAGADGGRGGGGWGWGWGGGKGADEKTRGGRALPCAMAIRLRGKGQVRVILTVRGARD